MKLVRKSSIILPKKIERILEQVYLNHSTSTTLLRAQMIALLTTKNEKAFGHPLWVDILESVN